MSFWDKKKAIRLFQKLPFSSTFIKTPHIKNLNNIDLFHELPFYDKLSIVKLSVAFARYEKSYKMELIDSKDQLVQLEASKSKNETKTNPNNNISLQKKIKTNKTRI